jgi:hypothetical protein
MFNDWHYVLAQDRADREQDLAERMAERGRYALPRKALPEGQVGAQALRVGGSRRERGDLAHRLGEVGGQGAPVERAPLPARFL